MSRRPLLDYTGAETYTGFSDRYLKRLVFERRIAHIKDRRRVFFDPDDLDRYIESLRVEPARDETPTLKSIKPGGHRARRRHQASPSRGSRAG